MLSSRRASPDLFVSLLQVISWAKARVKAEWRGSRPTRCSNIVRTWRTLHLGFGSNSHRLHLAPAIEEEERFEVLEAEEQEASEEEWLDEVVVERWEEVCRGLVDPLFHLLDLLQCVLVNLLCRLLQAPPF